MDHKIWKDRSGEIAQQLRGFAEDPGSVLSSHMVIPS